MSQKRIRRYAPLIVLLATTVSLALFFDWYPRLRGSHGWRWAHVALNPQIARAMVPGLVALLIYVLGLVRLRRAHRRLYLSWVFLGALTIPTLFLALYGNPGYVLYTRTVSDLTTGGYMAGARLEGPADWQTWPLKIANRELDYSNHILIGPPGWPVLYWLTAKWMALFPSASDPMGMALRPWQCHNPFIMVHSNAQIASAWLGLLSPLWGALTIFPLYRLGRRWESETAVRAAIAAWPMVPALSLFMGTLNTPYPFLATAVLALLVTGLNEPPRRRFAPLFLAGALMGFCLSLNFSLVPLIMLCGWLALLWPQTNLRQIQTWVWRGPIITGMQYGTGLLASLLAYRLVAGHHLWTLLPLAMKWHTELERPYLPWLWLHSWDVVLFVGLPLCGLFILGLLALPRGNSHKVALALGLTLFILVISGTARGETGRVWIFFTPLLLLVATAVGQHLTRRWQLALIGSQLLWLLVMVAVIRPISTGLSPPPDYTAIAPHPIEAPIVPVKADISDQLQLLGYQAQFDRDQHKLTLALYWQAKRQMSQSYLFAALAVTPEGHPVAQEKWLPLDYQYPTTCWFPEKTEQTAVRDTIEIDLGPNPVPGDWWLSLSAFSLSAQDTPVYLPVILPDGTVDDHQMGLGPVKIDP